MPNTYTQLFIQLVFAVKYRAALIEKEWKDRLHKYITAIIQANNHKMLQINTMPDHLHCFIGLNPDQSISSLVQKVKTQSSLFVNEKKLCRSKFAWQQGFGAFSYSKSHVQSVIRYIQNQDINHKSKSFLEEYQAMLKAFNIDYDERYIFKESI